MTDDETTTTADAQTTGDAQTENPADPAAHHGGQDYNGTPENARQAMDFAGKAYDAGDFDRARVLGDMVMDGTISGADNDMLLRLHMGKIMDYVMQFDYVHAGEALQYLITTPPFSENAAVPTWQAMHAAWSNGFAYDGHVDYGY